jgi:hypothetical protein
VNGEVDCFQERGREAARGAQDSCTLWLTTAAKICCEIKQKEVSGGCAREREEGENRREGMGSSHHVGIDEERRRGLRAPVRKFASLAVQSREKTEGKGEDIVGVL